MKRFLFLLPFALFANDESVRPIRPYVNLGYSQMIAIGVPYGVNGGAGLRTTITNWPIGLDLSFNHTENLKTRYTYGKAMLPLYFSPSTPEDSKYLGPFFTHGIEEKQPLQVVGLTYGSNDTVFGVLTFSQVNVNLLQLRDKRTVFFPSLTIQGGIGF